MAQRVKEEDKNNYPKASNALVIGGVIAWVGCLFLMVCFCAPYWIESYEESFSSFKHMGLWEYCFKDFQYPYYQFPKLFNGCHHIFSHEYYVIREYLLPGWLMFVQFCVTLPLLLTMGALAIIACEVCRWPLHLVLRYEWLFTTISCACVSISSFLLLLATLTFGVNAYRRDWLMYPKFNVLSWAYSCCVVAFMILGMAALLLFKEAKVSYRQRSEAKNLVMQMQHQEPHSGFHTPHSSHSAYSRGGYI